MANMLFGWPIYSDVGVTYTPALSNGSWSSSLPLTNLQDRRLHKVARSADALAASTKFDVDLGVARDVRVLAVLVPNITKSATPTIRWRGSTVSNFATSVYDSGTVSCWPTGMTAETVNGLNVWLTTIPSAAQTARYWRCELTDTGNTDGYLDVARAIIAGGFQPTVNMQYGAELGLEGTTTREVTDGGAALYNARPVRRTFMGVLDDMTEAEALASFFAMQHQLGTSGQLFAVWDSADTTYLWQRAFLAVLREVSPLQNATLARHRASFALVEEL